MLVWFLYLLGLLYHSKVDRKGTLADVILLAAHALNVTHKTLLYIASWLNSVFYDLFTYPKKFTNLNTFMNEMAHRCSDNWGPTAVALKNDYVVGNSV